MGEEISKSQAALKAALAGVDFGIHLNDGQCEGRLGFDVLGSQAGGFEAQRLIFDDSVEALEIHAGDGVPEFLPRSRLDADGLDIGPCFLSFRGLLPKASDEEERFSDVELAQRIAKTNRGAVFGGFWVNRDVAVFGIGLRRYIPLLSVAFWLIAAEKSIAQPFLKEQSVTLYLERGRPMAENGE